MFYGTQNVQLIVLWLVSGRRRPVVLWWMYVQSLLLLVPVSPGIIPSLVLAVAEKKPLHCLLHADVCV